MAVDQKLLEQHAALEERKLKSLEDASIPKITKALLVHNWIQSFNIYLSRKVGAQSAALTYVVCETAAVNADVPA